MNAFINTANSYFKDIYSMQFNFSLIIDNNHLLYVEKNNKFCIDSLDNPLVIHNTVTKCYVDYFEFSEFLQTLKKDGKKFNNDEELLSLMYLMFIVKLKKNQYPAIRYDPTLHYQVGSKCRKIEPHTFIEEYSNFNKFLRKELYFNGNYNYNLNNLRLIIDNKQNLYAFSKENTFRFFISSINSPEVIYDVKTKTYTKCNFFCEYIKNNKKKLTYNIIEILYLIFVIKEQDVLHVSFYSKLHVNRASFAFINSESFIKHI